MSRRENQNPNRNVIRGPHSALTDFLAANNISAEQIRLDYAQRVRDAEQSQGQNTSEEQTEENGEEEEEDEETAEQTRKRKRRQELAIRRIKKSKEYQKRRRQADDSEDSDDIAMEMFARSKPLPGQMDNCDQCGKRFTVTPYSREGPSGGLLCGKCSKELDAEKKKGAKGKKPAGKGQSKRQQESNRLDGAKLVGAKSLQQLCVEKVAEYVEDVEEFGDLPDKVVVMLAEIMSKRRLMRSRTLDLFLQPDSTSVEIYDAADLETDDFIRIFQVSPKCESLLLNNCGQLKDNVLEFIAERDVPLRHLRLEAPNLVTGRGWFKFFRQCGARLETLKLTWLDATLSDATLREVLAHCPNLRRLKLKRCMKLGDNSLRHIAKLKHLEHLALRITEAQQTKYLVELIRAVGPGLKSLSLDGFEASDDVLLEIRAQCENLTSLRFTESSVVRDQAFASLFSDDGGPVGDPNPTVVPPLAYLNVRDNRHIEAAEPDGPEDAAKKVGFGDEAFRALMRHSGQRLERLNLKSCRHITKWTLYDVFGVDDDENDKKVPKRYPMLEELDMSFVKNVDTVALAAIFRSCPALKRLVAFGCFSARDTVVPPGVVVVGLPNPKESIVQEG